MQRDRLGLHRTVGRRDGRDWYWCVWNEPNNLLVGGDLTFEQYRQIYHEVAAEILRQLAPHLNGRKARIGGPAIDGTHRALLDGLDCAVAPRRRRHAWSALSPGIATATGVRRCRARRSVREMWGSPDAPDGEVFQALLMGQTPLYKRARAASHVCCRAAISSTSAANSTPCRTTRHYYTLGLNQNAFGAAYYVSALIHLIRGGAEPELRWTATAHGDDAYGLMTMDGDPMPAAWRSNLRAARPLRRLGPLSKTAADHPEIDARRRMGRRRAPAAASSSIPRAGRVTVRPPLGRWAAVLR